MEEVMRQAPTLLDIPCPNNRQELGLSGTVLGNDHPDTLASMNNSTSVLSYQGKYEQAEKNTSTNTRAEHPSTLTSVYCLAYLLYH
jgi:hypothetical protein